MLRVHLLQGIGKPPLVLDATQVVVRLDDGTPISVSALFGGTDAVITSHVKDEGFHADLRRAGVDDKVTLERM
mgnify:CR=1 FL=1